MIIKVKDEEIMRDNRVMRNKDGSMFIKLGDDIEIDGCSENDSVICNDIAITLKQLLSIKIKPFRLEYEKLMLDFLYKHTDESIKYKLEKLSMDISEFILWLVVNKHMKIDNIHKFNIQGYIDDKTEDKLTD